MLLFLNKNVVKKEANNIISIPYFNVKNIPLKTGIRRQHINLIVRDSSNSFCTQ